MGIELELRKALKGIKKMDDRTWFPSPYLLWVYRQLRSKASNSEVVSLVTKFRGDNLTSLLHGLIKGISQKRGIEYSDAAYHIRGDKETGEIKAYGPFMLDKPFHLPDGARRLGIHKTRWWV